jgi:hypothetical protein
MPKVLNGRVVGACVYDATEERLALEGEECELVIVIRRRATGATTIDTCASA